MSRVFISYSREDLAIAEKIFAALSKGGLEPWIDQEDIPKGEEFFKEIQHGIERAEVMLFLVSPDSIRSEWCNKEIDYAIANNKRILPLVVRNTDTNDTKNLLPEISKRNWILCREGLDDFDKAIDETRNAIFKDHEWVKFHTELLERALKWGENKDDSRLLRGKDLQDAVDKILAIDQPEDPRPTNEQREYVFASQKGVERQRRRIIVILAIGLTIMVILSFIAWGQRTSAINSQSTAVVEANARATSQIIAEEQARISRARELVSEAQVVMDAFPQRGLLLSVEAARQNLEEGEPITADTAEALRMFLSNPMGIPLQNQIIGQGVISPNKRWFVLFDDQSLQLWDLNTTKPWLKPSAEYIHQGLISIQFSSNSIYVFVYSRNRIQILDLSQQNIVTSFDMPMTDMDICTATLSSNGDWFALTQCGGETIFIDVESQSSQPVEIGIVKSISYPYQHLSSSNGGWFLIYGGELPGQLWQILPDASPRKVIDKITGLDSAQFSMDNQWLIISTAVNGEKRLSAISLKNLGPEATPFELQVPESYSDFLLSSNGWLVISGGVEDAQQEIYLYDLRKFPGNLVPEVINTDQQYMSMAITNRWLIANTDTRVILWDMENFNPENHPVELSIPTGTIFYNISPDEYWLSIVGLNGQISMWNLEDFDPQPLILSGQDSSLTEIIYSSNHLWLATVSEDKGIRIWELKNSLSSNPTQILRGHDTEINYVVFSNQDRWLISTDIAGATRLWDMTNLNSTSSSISSSLNSIDLKGHRQYISAMAVTPGFELLVSGDLDGYIRVWDMRLNPIEQLFEIRPFDNINSIQISPDGRWLAVAGSGKETLLWDLSTSISLEPTYFLLGHEKEIEHLAFSPDSHVLASGGVDGRILLWELSDQGPGSVPIELCCSATNIIDGGHGITTLVFSPDSQLLFSGDVGGLGALWAMKDLRLPIQLMHSDGIPVISAAFSHSGKWVVSGGADFRAMIWDVESLGSPKEIKINRTQTIIDLSGKSSDGIVGLAFTPDDKELIVISSFLGQESDNSVSFWDMENITSYNTDAAYKLRGPNVSITTWGISPDGRFLAIGSGSLTIRNGPYASLYFWNLDDIGVPPSTFPEGNIEIRKLLFSNDGNWLIAGDSIIHIYSLNTNDLVKTACFFAARNLTQFEWEMYFPQTTYRETCNNLPDYVQAQATSSILTEESESIAKTTLSRAGNMWIFGVVVSCCLGGIILGVFLFLVTKKQSRFPKKNVR